MCQFRLLVGIASMVWTTLATAQNSKQSPAPATTPGPCSAVLAACKAAGYTQSGHKDGKGLHMDCVGKMFQGETVPGVVVTPEQIKSCQDRHGMIDRGMHGKLPAAAHSLAPSSTPKK